MLMDFLQFLLLLLSLIPAAYLCLHKLAMRKKSHNVTTESGTRQPMLPPGTLGWPLIGETYDYYSKRRENLTYKFLTERWNKYSASIFRTSLIGKTMVIFSKVEGNKFLFSNEKKLVQVWWPTTLDTIFPKTDKKPSAEQSHTLRNLLRWILKIDGLREYISIIDEVTRQHLQTDWNCKQVSVCDVTKRYLFTLSSNIFLGINDPGKIERLAKNMKDIEEGFFSMPINLPGTALNRAIKAAKLISKELMATIRQRRIDLQGHDLSSRKDFMSTMLLAKDENGQAFCDEDVASHLAGLLLASFSTMHSTITSMMKYLAELPDVYDSVFREQNEILDVKPKGDHLTWEDIQKMKYSWSVASEVLRISTPGFGGFREAITDFTYEGFTVPKGSKIFWTFDATHKNPKYFPDPEKFEPSRFQGNGPAPYAFVPFGGGPRMCPGNEYARVVILVFMHNVVTKFRWEKLIPGENMIYYPAPRPARGLPVTLHPNKP
ncbi:dammarenediol 12-hydroxylase-like [Coffea arabica]|uniref:Dammarenediol 12-hydroxylase-like n=1 Tax=Coffea arabica TaxID=13443 RepID=A0A6P6VC96_COFAR